MQKKSKNVFLPKRPQYIVVGPEWSSSTHRVPGNSFRPSYTPKSIFKKFLKSRNFDHKIHFWKVGCPTSLKNAFGSSTKNLTCFSIFIFRSNVTRGAKYGTISNFLSYGFAIQGLVLKKFHFSTSSCEKTFKIKLKLLQKCLKKMQKKSQKFFFFQNVPNPL